MISLSFSFITIIIMMLMYNGILRIIRSYKAEATAFR